MAARQSSFLRQNINSSRVGTVVFVVALLTIIMSYCFFLIHHPHLHVHGQLVSALLTRLQLTDLQNRPGMKQASAPSGPPPPSNYDFCEVSSPPLIKFIEPLPFPRSIDVSSGHQLTLGAYKITQSLHRDLPNTTLYAFGTSQETAAFPGPTLMARRHVAAHIRWENHIPDDHHFLPRSPYVEWANPQHGGVPIVTHLHGAEVSSLYDGHPDAWFTSRNETGPAFVTQNYTYPNHQHATMLWYHDHTFGITHLNVLAGLSGLYIILPNSTTSPVQDADDDEQQELNLPNGIPLVLKDWRLFPNGSINLPGPQNGVPIFFCPEWFDTWLVNGKAWPFLHVSPRPYRFRFLNACNARFVAMYLNMETNQNLTFLQIGSDGGFLQEPIRLHELIMAPADRADVVVDFSDLGNGTEVILRNLPVDPNMTFSHYIQPQTFVIMKFLVVDEGGTDEGLIEDSNYEVKVASTLHIQELLLQDELRRQQSLQLQKGTMAVPPRWRVITMDPHDIDGFIFQYTLENQTWRDPVTINPIIGRDEVWQIINLDIPYPKNGSCFVEYPQPPGTYQRGWKDNAISWPFTMLRILVRFTTRDGSPYSFDATQGPGYVVHCHVVQHEDHSMMRPFQLHYEEGESFIM